MSGMEKGDRRLRVACRHVANRPRLCKNAKRNLLSKYRPSKTRCIRLFLIGYWSEDPRIRNSIEFLHSLGQKRPLNDSWAYATAARPPKCAFGTKPLCQATASTDDQKPRVVSIG